MRGQGRGLAVPALLDPGLVPGHPPVPGPQLRRAGDGSQGAATWHQVIEYRGPNSSTCILDDDDIEELHDEAPLDDPDQLGGVLGQAVLGPRVEGAEDVQQLGGVDIY